MPLYEYECRSCRERTEAIQSFSEPPLTVCPKCGGALVKLLSSPAVQFKGSGWYVTDYGKSGGRSEKTGEKEGDSSKGEEGGGAAGSATSDASAGEAAKTGDASKGKKDKDGGGSAASGTPGAAPPHAPSKQKKGRRK